MVKLRAGDRAAFKELYSRHSARVYAYLWRMLRDEAQAEDLRQEVFIRLWEVRRQWTGGGSVAGYLIRVARNLAVNASERSRLRARIAAESPSEFRSAPPPPPDVSIEQQQLVGRVQDAIDSLPDRARQVFTLKRDAGLSYREIGELLDISPKTVEVHIGTAFKLLRQALADLREK